jgi:hypothetical protein
MKNILFDNYNSENGKKFIQETINYFTKIISVLEEHYNIKPFSQQTAQSLTELFLIVKILKPSTIFELGCGTRSSTIALSQAIEKGCLYGIDFSPVNFDELVNKSFPGMIHAPVIDHTMNAVDFFVPKTWERPIFTLYDAHDDDLPGIKIFPHAEKMWFPELKNSIVAFHDCTITDQLIIYPSESDHYSSKHFNGRYISGYGESVSLTKWMNKSKIDFYRPGDDLTKLGFTGNQSSLICVEIL